MCPTGISQLLGKIGLGKEKQIMLRVCRELHTQVCCVAFGSGSLYRCLLNLYTEVKNRNTFCKHSSSPAWRGKKESQKNPWLVCLQNIYVLYVDIERQEGKNKKLVVPLGWWLQVWPLHPQKADCHHDFVVGRNSNWITRLVNSSLCC